MAMYMGQLQPTFNLKRAIFLVKGALSEADLAEDNSEAVYITEGGGG